MPSAATSAPRTVAPPAERLSAPTAFRPAEPESVSNRGSARCNGAPDELSRVLARSVVSRVAANPTLSRAPDVWTSLGYGFWVLEEDGTYLWHEGVDSTGYVKTDLPKHKDKDSYFSWPVFKRMAASTVTAESEPAAKSEPQDIPKNVAVSALDELPQPGLNFPPPGATADGITKDVDSPFGRYHFHAINAGTSEDLQPPEPSPKMNVFRLVWIRYVDEPQGRQHLAFDHSGAMLAVGSLFGRNDSRSQMLKADAVVRVRKFLDTCAPVSGQQVLDRRDALVQQARKAEQEESERQAKGVEQLKAESKAKLGQGSSGRAYVPPARRQATAGSSVGQPQGSGGKKPWHK